MLIINCLLNDKCACMLVLSLTRSQKTLLVRSAQPQMLRTSLVCVVARATMRCADATSIVMQRFKPVDNDNVSSFLGNLKAGSACTMFGLLDLPKCIFK